MSQRGNAVSGSSPRCSTAEQGTGTSAAGGAGVGEAKSSGLRKRGKPPRMISRQVQAVKGRCVKAIQTENMSHSLFFFSRHNFIRASAIRLVRDYRFENLVLTSVVLSSLVFAATDPLSTATSPRNVYLTWINNVLSSFFILECACKVVADGFLLESDSYLRAPWNILDFACVVGSIVGWVPGMGNSSSTRILRTVRVFRPLSALHRFPQLQLLANTLFAAVVQMKDVSIMLVVFVVFLGTIGLQLFEVRPPRTQPQRSERRENSPGLVGWGSSEPQLGGNSSSGARVKVAGGLPVLERCLWATGGGRSSLYSVPCAGY